jgi:hypothetical protein
LLSIVLRICCDEGVDLRCDHQRFTFRHPPSQLDADQREYIAVACYKSALPKPKSEVRPADPADGNQQKKASKTIER